MMIYERYQDMLETFFAWRCVICGEVVDDVVIENRKGEKERETSATG
jgi:hypothetical protein